MARDGEKSESGSQAKSEIDSASSVGLEDENNDNDNSRTVRDDENAEQPEREVSLKNQLSKKFRLLESSDSTSKKESASNGDALGFAERFKKEYGINNTDPSFFAGDNPYSAELSKIRAQIDSPSWGQSIVNIFIGTPTNSIMSAVKPVATVLGITGQVSLAAAITSTVGTQTTAIVAVEAIGVITTGGLLLMGAAAVGGIYAVYEQHQTDIKQYQDRQRCVENYKELLK